MAKQPEFHKYLPLEEWFRNQPTTSEQIELTFDQVEAILEAPLPKSATKLTTWWTACFGLYYQFYRYLVLLAYPQKDEDRP